MFWSLILLEKARATQVPYPSFQMPFLYLRLTYLTTKLDFFAFCTEICFFSTLLQSSISQIKKPFAYYKMHSGNNKKMLAGIWTASCLKQIYRKTADNFILTGISFL
jgi:hypothetical protein